MQNDTVIVVGVVIESSFGGCAVIVREGLPHIVFFHHVDARIDHKRVKCTLLVLCLHPSCHGNLLGNVHGKVLEGFCDLLYVCNDVGRAPHRLVIHSRLQILGVVAGIVVFAVVTIFTVFLLRLG